MEYEDCDCSWVDGEPEKPCGCGHHAVRLYRDRVIHWKDGHWLLDCAFAEAAAERHLSHDQMWKVARSLPTDFEPYGQRDREEDWGPDCSCGCRWFHPLEGKLRYDWGVCGNPESPRAGLLTFEHMGCKHFEWTVESLETQEQE